MAAVLELRGTGKVPWQELFEKCDLRTGLLPDLWAANLVAVSRKLNH
jgi:hypothetical protein